MPRRPTPGMSASPRFDSSAKSAAASARRMLRVVPRFDERSISFTLPLLEEESLHLGWCDQRQLRFPPETYEGGVIGGYLDRGCPIPAWLWIMDLTVPLIAVRNVSFSVLHDWRQSLALRVFPIAGSHRSKWGRLFVLTGAAIVLPSLVALLVVLWPNHVRFEVTSAGLRVRGSVYGRSIPATAIRLDGTRRLTVDDTPGIYPNRRTNGIGLPDYLAGWFRLNDGRSALLFVTDWSRTIAVPTTAGYDLVLSPDAPDALVAMVKAPAAAGSAPGIFPLATAPARGWDASDLLPWLAFVLVPLVTVALLAPLLFAGRRVRFELGDESLRIRGDLYGRTIPRSDLQAAGAAVIDIKRHTTFGRMLRTNGIGLPNYLSGWFRPHGDGRALLFVTDQTRVVAVPTTAGYQLLLSPADPEGFLAALRGGSE